MFVFFLFINYTNLKILYKLWNLQIGSKMPAELWLLNRIKYRMFILVFVKFYFIHNIFIYIFRLKIYTGIDEPFKPPKAKCGLHWGESNNTISLICEWGLCVWVRV